MVADGKSEHLLKRIYARFKELAEQCEFVLCEGTDFTGIASAFEFDFNAEVANQLGCPLVIVANGQGKTRGEVVSVARAARESYGEEGCTVVATMVNRVRPEDSAAVLEQLKETWRAVNYLDQPSIPLRTWPSFLRGSGISAEFGYQGDSLRAQCEKIRPGSKCGRRPTRIRHQARCT